MQPEAVSAERRQLLAKCDDATFPVAPAGDAKSAGLNYGKDGDLLTAARHWQQLCQVDLSEVNTQRGSTCAQSS